MSLIGAGVLVAAGFVVGLIVGVVSEEPELVVGHLAGRSENVPWTEERVAGAGEGTPAVQSADTHAEFAADAGTEEIALGAGALTRRQRPPTRTDGAAPGEPSDIDLPSQSSLPAEPAEPPRAAQPTQRVASPPTAHIPAASAPLPSVAAPPRSGLREPRAIEDLPQSQPVATGGEFAVQVGAFAEASMATEMRDKLRRKGFDVYVVSGAESGDGRTRVQVGPVASKAAAQALADKLKREERLPTWVLPVSGS